MRRLAGIQLRRQQRVDHVVAQVGQQQGLQVDPRIVLGRDEHRLERHRLAVLVGHTDLGLAVRAQVGQYPDPPDLGQPLRQTVGQPDGKGHQVRGLVAGVPEHHPLVARPLGVEHILAPGAGPDLEGIVDALADVGRLLVDRHDDSAGPAVDAVGVVVVADVDHGLTHQPRDVHVRGGGDLTRHQDQAGGQEGLARHPALRVLGQHGVEHGVRDLVRHLVGVSLGHRF